MAQRREELEQYLLGAVTPERQAEVNALLEQDAVWQQVYQQLLQEKQGIRFNALTRLKQKLSAYEESQNPEEKYFENISVDAGDLSMVSAPPDDRPTKQTEEATSMTPTPAEPDDLTRQGIRYHALRMVQDKLEEEEKKFFGPEAEEEQRRIRKIKPWVKWLGIAAGILSITTITLFSIYSNKNFEIKNRNLYDNLDLFILHNIYRSEQKSNINLDSRGYYYFQIREFKLAEPYLKKSWEMNSDTLSLFYLYVISKSTIYNYKIDKSVLVSLYKDKKYNKLMEILNQINNENN